MSVNDGATAAPATVDAAAIAAVDQAATGTSIGEGGVKDAGSSVSIGFDMGNALADKAAQDAGAETRAALEKLIPQSDRDKEWIKNSLKSADPIKSIIDQYENAQKLVGQKAAPAAAPATVDEYKYSPPQFETPEDNKILERVQQGRDPNFIEALRPVAHKAGLSTQQWQTLLEGHDRLVVQQQKAIDAHHAQEQEKSDQEFNSMADKWFPGRKDAVFKNGDAILDKTTPPEMRAIIAGLPNKAKMALAMSLDFVRQKYIREDGFDSGTAGSAAASSEAAIRENIRQLMSDSDYANDLSAKSIELRRKVTDLYKQLGSLRKT